MLRKLALVLLASLALVLGIASPALAAGSVANSCAVSASVEVWKKEVVNGITGYRISYLPCGTGTSNVYRATVWSRPFYVKIPGRQPFCLQAGQWFYPYNSGGSTTAVLTPTVRC